MRQTFFKLTHLCSSFIWRLCNSTFLIFAFSILSTVSQQPSPPSAPQSIIHAAETLASVGRLSSTSSFTAPTSLSRSSLLSLPFTSIVPSLSPAIHLVVTFGQPEQISINNVGVSDTPIFNDGLVFVYAVDDVFKLNFTIADANPANLNPRSDFQCLKLESSSRFGDASGVLKSRGYSLFSFNGLITDSLLSS
ncbi:Putative fasciclin-like arabinogalactan protein 20 [Striga hermonthica]|uniref:Fasciclin-like arabinogalactan protein 20 n=1 Tax=Striga hermonthica TaxID=68872 RepID=A0A9N7RF89_STRHE|nr:Putative fasciclin-like arabinogalactan protein 20 [Striga hermonthica]